MYWQLDCDSKEAMHVEAKVYVSNYIHVQLHVCKLLYYTCSGSWILSHMKPSGFHMYYICIYMYM